jgi:hypothetical protein
MKTLLVGLMVLGSMSVFAGSIKTKSGKYLDFSIDNEKSIISLTTNEPSLETYQTFNIMKIEKKHTYNKKHIYSELPPMGITKAFIESEGGVLEAYTVLPIALMVNVADIVLLPFSGSDYLIKKMRENRDFSILKKAIETDNEITVNKKRFSRLRSFF